MSPTLEKQRLLLISDLWGWTDAEWKNFYLNKLSSDFKVVLYDSQILGRISASASKGPEKELHQAFLNGGIEKAAHLLLAKESLEKPATILAFSVGATIAWKAMSMGLFVKKLVGIAGTRLRYETKKPSGNIHLYFGEKDPYAPKDNWFNNIQLPKNIISGYGHELYKEKEFCNFITLELPSK